MFGAPFLDDKIAKGKKLTPDEIRLSQRMMSAWAQFARNGQPGFDEFKSGVGTLDKPNRKIDFIITKIPQTSVQNNNETCLLNSSLQVGFVFRFKQNADP